MVCSFTLYMVSLIVIVVLYSIYLSIPPHSLLQSTMTSTPILS